MRSIALLGLALLSLGCNAPAHPPEPVSVVASGLTAASSEAQAVAQAALDSFLERVPAGMEQAYGFADRAQIFRAIAGEPYAVLTWDPSGEVFAATSQWRVPVVSDGAMRALLTVTQVSGRLQAVDFGAAGLAGELDRLEKERGIAGQPASRRLRRFLQLRADVVALGGPTELLQGSSIVPLASGRVALGLNGAQREWSLEALSTAARARYRALPAAALR